MKTFKKTLSLTLMLALVLATIISAPVFASNIEFSDVDEKTQFSTAIYELVADGIINGYEDSTFRPNNTISRAEFSKVIGIALEGKGAIWDATVTNFTDAKGHWAVPYISYAATMGIINGYEDGTFRPDKPVTYAEAVKMIVCALGYGPVVDTTLVPWYTGYIQIADSIGLAKNAVAKADNGAPRGLVAQLISNMKSCKKLVYVGVDSSGKPKYETADQDNYSDEGVVVGVFDKTLRGNEISLSKKEIKIDNKTYTLSDSLGDSSNYAEYLGKSVEYSYEDKNKLIINSIWLSSRNETAEVTVDQLDYSDGQKVYYYEKSQNTKHSTYTLDSNLYIVYNGVGVPSSRINTAFIKNAFNIETGSVIFYNNDADSAMDVAFIENYKTYLMGSSPVSNNGVYTINDKNGFESPVTVDEDEASVYKVTSAGSRPVSAYMSNITSNAVVSVGVPLDTTVGATVMISTATKSGVIESMDSNCEEIKIGSTTYGVSPYFRKLIAKNSKEKPTVGSNVTAYLDYLGRIVATKINSSSTPYGYLVDYYLYGRDTHNVDILTTRGKIETYSLADKVRVNGESIEKANVPAKLKASAAYVNNEKNAEYKVNAEYSQLVKYELNGQEITKIQTVGQGDGDINKSTSTNCSTKYIYNKIGNNFVDGSGRTVFNMNDYTIVFAVPADRAAEEKKYAASDSTYFYDGDAVFVEAYDFADGGKTAGVVVCYIEKGGSASNEKVKGNTATSIIVGKINLGETAKFTLVTMGDTNIESDSVELETSEDLGSMASYKVGDVIRYVESNGVIVDIEKIYVGGSLVGASNNLITREWDGDSKYYRVMMGTLCTKEYGNGASGAIDVTTEMAVKDSSGKYTLDTSLSTRYTVDDGTPFYKIDTVQGKKSVKMSNFGELSAAADCAGKVENASRVIVVVYDKKVQAVYNIGNASN